MKHFQKHDVKLLSEEYLFQGFMNLKVYLLQHRLFAGGWSQPIKRELLERAPVAAALPYDPIQNKVILIEQFRTGALKDAKPWLMEIIAGITKEEESIEALIKRELQEESGLTAKSLHKLYEYWVSPGGTNEYVTLYCARVNAPSRGGVFGLKQENEDIKVHVLDTEKAFEMLSSGKINNALTIIALQWLALHKKEIDDMWQ